MNTHTPPNKILAASVFLALFTTCAVAEEGVVVEVVKMQFVPEKIKIKPNMTVTWVNAEKRSNHSVLFESDGSESDRFFPGESWQRTFDKPGTYLYHCGTHPEMKGVVEVEE